MIMIGCEVMKKRKMLTVDWIFLIGIILIAIIGGIIEGVYWHITDIEPLPKYTLRSGVVSYIYWIILLIYSAYKYENKIEKPKYVKFYWVFILPLFHIIIALMFGVKLSSFIINIFNL